MYLFCSPQMLHCDSVYVNLLKLDSLGLRRRLFRGLMLVSGRASLEAKEAQIRARASKSFFSMAATESLTDWACSSNLKPYITICCLHSLATTFPFHASLATQVSLRNDVSLRPTAGSCKCLSFCLLARNLNVAPQPNCYIKVAHPPPTPKWNLHIFYSRWPTKSDIHEVWTYTYIIVYPIYWGTPKQAHIGPNLLCERLTKEKHASR